MLFDSEGYVARAEECRRLAEVTEDIPLREQFLSLHHGFLEYARQLEARKQTSSGVKQQEMS